MTGDGAAIAVIPARGGSKRVPRKNVRPFAGRPMIGWPIATALESGLFDAVLVSTDDEEIARAAEACGALCPFRRPAALADDVTPLRPVIRHAVAAWEEGSGRRAGLVCSLLATAALVTPEELRQGRALLAGPAVAFAFSAERFPAPVQRAFTIGPDGGLAMREPEHRFTRSQDLPPCYFDAGQFYWGRRDAWLSEEPMYGPRARAVVLPPGRVVDIDLPEDWERAERLFALRRAEAP